MEIYGRESANSDFPHAKLQNAKKNCQNFFCQLWKTRQIWGIWKLRPAYSQETPNLGQNRWCFVPCDLQIWWMTLENNRASLLCCFKLCATFHSHWWIQTGVTVRKCPIWVKFQQFLEPCDLEIWRMTLNKANLRDLIAATGLVISNWIQIVNFSARVTVKFDGWPCKKIGHLFYATSSFVHLFVPIGEFKLKLQSGNAQSGSNGMTFRAVRPWNLTDVLAIQ